MQEPFVTTYVNTCNRNTRDDEERKVEKTTFRIKSIASLISRLSNKNEHAPWENTTAGYDADLLYAKLVGCCPSCFRSCSMLTSCCSRWRLSPMQSLSSLRKF